ncbi:uncharacterized protein PGTG_14353 [Puccinia graminis f. sp. tritici CRL 75-36-700-3]|uniref:Uncharacterized protein n=1 Tax=Puccinia graminis f. sp. tritici (strain CRL 75-36-700-3 / race SCCL) TaxID=418459 RepID=E3KV46_PUCGT|nr:uncharacterized protein PGTG_14353 [Puccinia graminis f. sp. tritici CRL 75-36-700-3]EFP88269.1 hypothetical protein PGTG_14353 [Puccinia graminis f. sp. tritici CRL 75-36-700-3]
MALRPSPYSGGPGAPAKISSIQDRFNLDGQPQSTPPSQPPSTVDSRPGSSASTQSSKAPGKPILKHRSLSEILRVGLSQSGESASEDGSEDGKARPDQPKRAQVSIAHASSDSTLVKLGNAGVARGSSHTIINGYDSSDLATSGDDSDVACRTSAMRGHSSHASREEPLPTRWYTDQLVGRDSFRRAGLKTSSPGGTLPDSRLHSHLRAGRGSSHP